MGALASAAAGARVAWLLGTVAGFEEILGRRALSGRLGHVRGARGGRGCDNDF